MTVCDPPYGHVAGHSPAPADLAAVVSLPGPSVPRGCHRRSDREPATAAGGNAFALLRRYAGDRDRPAGAAQRRRLMAGAKMPDRPRPAAAAKRSDSPSSAPYAPDRGAGVARTWQPSLAPQRYELAALWWQVGLYERDRRHQHTRSAAPGVRELDAGRAGRRAPGGAGCGDQAAAGAGDVRAWRPAAPAPGGLPCLPGAEPGLHRDLLAALRLGRARRAGLRAGR
jgi:hypothetical protein